MQAALPVHDAQSARPLLPANGRRCYPLDVQAGEPLRYLQGETNYCIACKLIFLTLPSVLPTFLLFRQLRGGLRRSSRGLCSGGDVRHRGVLLAPGGRLSAARTAGRRPERGGACPRGASTERRRCSCIYEQRRQQVSGEDLEYRSLLQRVLVSGPSRQFGPAAQDGHQERAGPAEGLWWKCQACSS
jgi:hypothetical protein